MENNIRKEQQYIRARQKVEKISKFYRHLSIYLIVNLFLSGLFIYNDVQDGDTFNEAFFSLGNYKIWLYWGIAILFQALGTFGLPLFLSKDWEERKIKEYLNEENRR